MTEDDDTVETVVYQGQQAAKQLGEDLHRSSPVSCLGNKIIGQTTGGNQSTPPRDGRGKKGFKGKKPQVSFPCSAHESAPPRESSSTGRNPLGFQNFKYLWVVLEQLRAPRGEAVSAMKMSWQTETGRLVCRWRSEVGQYVQYDPHWMQDASRSIHRENVLQSVPVFTRLSPFGGREWYALNRQPFVHR